MGAQPQQRAPVRGRDFEYADHERTMFRCLHTKCKRKVFRTKGNFMTHWRGGKHLKIRHLCTGCRKTFASKQGLCAHKKNSCSTLPPAVRKRKAAERRQKYAQKRQQQKRK